MNLVASVRSRWTVLRPEFVSESAASKANSEIVSGILYKTALKRAIAY